MRRPIRKYYDMVVQDALEKLPGLTLQYDAVLVDEGQDFSDAMLKIVMALLNPATNHLAIALDENQNIYQRRRSWKEMGIQARGRSIKRAFCTTGCRKTAGRSDPMTSPQKA